jgi:hypothetical protein
MVDDAAVNATPANAIRRLERMDGEGEPWAVAPAAGDDPGGGVELGVGACCVFFLLRKGDWRTAAVWNREWVRTSGAG